MISGGAPKNLMPLAPCRAIVTNPGTGFFGLQDWAIGTHAEPHVGHDPGRGNGVVFTALLVIPHPVKAVETAGFADGRDAMRQPQLCRIFRRHALVVPAEVGMHVDKTGQQVVTLQFHHLVAFFYFRAIVVRYWNAGKADIVDRSNPITLYHDVHRADWRSPFSIYNGYPSQDQSFEWTLAPIAVGYRFRRAKRCKTDEKQRGYGQYT